MKYLCNWCHGPCRWPVNWSLTHQSSSECCCCPKGPNKEPVMQWLPIPLHHYPPLNEAPAWVCELLRVWVVTGSPASVQQIAPHTASTVSVNRLTRGLLTFMAPTCLQTHTGWGMQDVQEKAVARERAGLVHPSVSFFWMQDLKLWFFRFSTNIHFGSDLVVEGPGPRSLGLPKIRS